MDQEKDTNPIAEIFDEMFTLLEGLETRSAAMLNYLQEQQHITDEKLAPYLDRAAAASDVRWRAARARMEHLLAPKPKSATEATSDANAKGKDEKPKGAKPQGEKEQGSKPELKDLGKELASAQPGDEKSATQKSGEPKDDKSQAATKPKADNEPPQNQQDDAKREQGADAKPKDTEAQASALAGENKSEKTDRAKNVTPQSDSEKPKSESSAEEKQQTQKASK
jgi:hypothetical protein